MRSLRKTTSAIALAIAVAGGLAVAGPAMAQQTIYGQGATLPAGLYNDWFTPTPVANYAFFYNAARGGVASLTGSGAGKNSFTSHSFNNVGATSASANYDVQFAGSDAILNASDIATYSTTNPNTGVNVQTKFGPPIQVPSVGTPVTISYNPTGLTRTRQGPTGLVSPTGTQTSGPIIYLSRASYCGIFTGGITTWNHPRIRADNGVAPSTQPIKVVVRSDGSGTTEIFTRHLDTVCDGSAAAGGFSFPDTRRAADQSVASVPPPGRTGGTTATGDNVVDWEAIIDKGRTPSRVIRAAGSGGVSTQIAANQFSVGYVSPDFTNVVATPAPGAGSPLPVPANLQNQADITNARLNLTHSPSFTNVVAAQSTIPAPAATDSALLWGQKLNLRVGGTTPSAVDPRNNPTAANAYPINGFTFLDFYTCYPAVKLAGVRGLVSYFTTTSAAAGSADTEAKTDGFAPLSATLKNAVRGRALASGTAPRGISRGPIASVCTL